MRQIKQTQPGNVKGQSVFQRYNREKLSASVKHKLHIDTYKVEAQNMQK
jgi:hypothetical protein